MKNSLFRINILYSIVYQVITIITPLITAPYLSRVLGPDGIGEYNYTLSYANFFFLLAMLGVNNYGNRSIAQTKNNKEKLSQTFWEIYSLQLILAIFSTVCYFLFCIFLFEDSKKSLFIIQGLVVFSATTDINWFAFGLEKFKYTTLRNIIIKVVTVLMIFLFVRSKGDTWIYILITEAGIIGGLLMLWPLVRSEVYFRKPTLQGIVRHLKPNLILFMPLLATSIYQYTDKIMLGLFVNEKTVGHYAYAESILNIPLGIITAVCTVAMPRVTNLLALKNKEDADNIFKNGLISTTIIEIALFWGILAIADRFIPLYLGEEFKETATILKLLAVVVILLGTANVVRMMFLVPKEMDKLYSISIFIGAIVNIVGNFVLIPNIGCTGACISTIGAYLVVLIIQIYGSRKYIYYPSIYFRMTPIFVLGYVMYSIIQVIDNVIIINEWVLLLLEIVSGALIFTIGTTIIILLQRKKNV